MTVTGKLAASIDTFCDSPKGSRACFFITILACFLHTFLSYGTDNWVELSEGPTESNQGLWNHCSKTISNTDITCSQSVTNFLEYSNQGVPGKLERLLRSIIRLERRFNDDVLCSSSFDLLAIYSIFIYFCQF